MKETVPYLQDTVAVAFVALGLVTAYTWLRRRDRSLGFLASAIILLAAVSGLGRLHAHIPIKLPVLRGLDLLAFSGSAFDLLLYRNSVIPIPRRWHAVAIASLSAVSVLILAAVVFQMNRALLIGIALAYFIVWCACLIEPTVRFWLVARGLPAVQAWRPGSPSRGFGGLVALPIVAFSVGPPIRRPVLQVLIALVALALIP